MSRAAKIRRLQKKLLWCQRQYRKISALVRRGRKPRRNRSNPKRDGTPTRGELRQGKYLEHLRRLAKAGQDAHSQLLRLQGRGGSSNDMHQEPALKAPKTETQTAHPGHYAPAADESSEARHIKQSLHDIQVLTDDYKSQLVELGDSDDNTAEAEVVQNEIIKLAQRAKKLKTKAAELGLVMSNPGRHRRRSNPGYYKRRRNSPRRSYYR